MSGNISTLVGIGTSGFSGDGGSATAAQLGVPAGVAVDLLGNIYINDQLNYRIRKASAGSAVSSISGPSSLCVGSTITLSDITAGGVWSSLNSAVATIGSTGIVTGTGSGTTTISYTESNACGNSVCY